MISVRPTISLLMVGLPSIFMVNFMLNLILLSMMVVSSLPLEPGERSPGNGNGGTNGGGSGNNGGNKEEEVLRQQNGAIISFEYELSENGNGGGHSSHSSSQKINQCYFQPDGRYYQPGSSWHPYLPPFGINKCSLCTCQNSTLKITCRRHFTCPPLACDPEQAVREHPTDCCKKCPDSIQVKSLDGAFGSDEATSLSDSNMDTPTTGACVLLGRLYPNGHRWHPHVTPFGEIRCVKCICKNGSIKCNRLKCPRGKCSNSPMMRKCCPNCGDSDR